jgi:hypothetical protein
MPKYIHLLLVGLVFPKLPKKHKPGNIKASKAFKEVKITGKIDRDINYVQVRCAGTEIVSHC